MSGNSPVAEAVDASKFRMAIVAARYNGELVDALLSGVEGELRKAGVKKGRLSVIRVPGSHELPIAARLLLDSEKLDAVIALGVIIRGATLHFELVADAASRGLMDVALEARVPVINGVIAADSPAQARERCSGRINRAAEFASAALSMAHLARRLRR